ncbi:hypothetical protein PSAB6_30400 [Paraburkholderia sabiae]|nr:hypothetical protein PSAB6_30400 [Paraburkholderia sabiae]
MMIVLPLNNVLVFIVMEISPAYRPAFRIIRADPGPNTPQFYVTEARTRASGTSPGRESTTQKRIRAKVREARCVECCRHTGRDYWQRSRSPSETRITAAAHFTNDGQAPGEGRPVRPAW